MKNIKIIMTCLFMLLFCVTALAKADLSNLHSSKQAEASKSLRAAYQTQIYVVNHSSEPIRVKVPGASIHDVLFPGEAEDIHSNYYYDAVEIALYYMSGEEFFRDFVPNHTTLEINDIFKATRSEGSKHKVQAVIKK